MSTSPSAPTPGLVAHALHALVSQIPTSTEKPADVPALRAQALARSAALRAGALSGGFTLPPGPFALATVLPDLLAVWRIQQQLVADIAATFGRSDALTRETMLVCLFKHGGAAITPHLLSRNRKNDAVVVHRIASRALHQLLEKIAVRVGQRIAARSVSRWVPLLGAVGAGAYAYYDTTHVARNALELFSRPIEIEASPVAAAADTPEAAPVPARRSHARQKPRATKRRAASASRRRAGTTKAAARSRR